MLSSFLILLWKGDCNLALTSKGIHFIRKNQSGKFSVLGAILSYRPNGQIKYIDNILKHAIAIATRNPSSKA